MALYATNRFPGDGSTTSYEFNFVGKYIARSHVKVYQEDNATKARTHVSITNGNFLNDTTLRGLPATPVGSTLVIYRDTPKPPLVDFVNGARFTEYNMDLVARQGLFVAMETLDAGDSGAREQLLAAIAGVTGLVNDATAAVSGATAAALAAAAAKADADVAKDQAIVAATEATAAAKNNLKYFNSFANATTGALLLQGGADVEVYPDETRAGARTRYKVQARALVFVANLDQLRLDLADPAKGTEIVAYDGGTVRDVLDDAKTMPSYKELRAYTGRATGVRITSRGIAGFFQRDAADTASVDNGGTTIVDASNRRWKRAFDGYFNVTWFGAVGNGVSGNAAANTAAINACIAAAQKNGGTVYFPAGMYDVNPLTYDIETLSQTGARVSILGDGPGLSVLRCGSMYLNDDILKVNAKHLTAVNSIVNAGHISNIGFLSTNGNGGGLRLANIAYFYVENVHASGCNTGLRISGSLSGTVINSKFSGNALGVHASRGATGFSSPNAITFIQCVIASNSTLGIYLSNPGGLRMFGGSVEGNGTGTANGYGILIDHTETEGSSVAADIQGVYFEFNKGVADIKLAHVNPNENVTLNVRSCSFDCGGTNVVTDRIAVEHISAKAVILNVSECNFSELAGFSPSTAYKYIRVFGAGSGAKNVTTFGNFYQSANSVPDFSQVKQLPVSSSARVEAFTGLTNPAGLATIQLSGFTSTPRLQATVLDGSTNVAWSTSIVAATPESATVRVHRQPTSGGAWAVAGTVNVYVLAIGN